MADFTQIIQEINEDITTNGVGAITGAKLNEVLRDMIDAVNAAKQDPLTIDATPTEDSTNPVQSGGVFTALNNLYNALAVAGNCLFGGIVTRLESPYQGDDHRYYYITQQVGYFPHFDITISNDEPTAIMIYWSDIVSKWVSIGLWPKLAYVDKKADKVDGATQGNLAGLDFEGNPTDSGKSPSDFATAEQGTKADTAVQPSDLATVATSGSYSDLLNKPTIPAAQVQSDWNEADNTKVDYIKNKPTIPDVSGKADKVVGATSGDVATIDNTGNLTDSGLSVFDFFVMVEDASTPPASMSPNTVYKYGTLSGNTTFPPLATPTKPDIANVYCWTFATPSTAPTITWPVAITAWAGGSAPTINASKSYEVSVMDGLATIIEA